ncbi:MAG: methyltransferase [Schleiferiaceae bacterium]|nr:methyltransferase [Schleiferiaceae bacterium]
MPNTWFRFQQFTIEHAGCAMKVGTDGVLLGAWANLNPPPPETILDIGTGTGLIALMLAQRFPNALVDAIEIEPNCFLQCQKNVSASPWANRIHPIQGDFLQFAQLNTSKCYDLITCNPPFFRNAFSPNNTERKTARHGDDTLALEDLFYHVTKLISKVGVICLILPFDLLALSNRLAVENHLFIKRLTKVKGTPHAPVKRVLLELSPIHHDSWEEKLLIIEENRNIRTTAYQSLTKHFYL